MRLRGHWFFIVFFALAFLADASAQVSSSPPGPEKSGEFWNRALGMTPEPTNQPSGPVDTSGLAEAIPRAIAWDNYWFGHWDDKVTRLALAKTNLTAWPVSAENGEAIYVFVDELHSQFDCYREEGKVSVQSIEDFEDRKDLEAYDLAKKRFGAVTQKLSIPLTPDSLRVVQFDPFDQPKTAKLRQIFDQQILNKEFFSQVKEYRSPSLAHHPIRIHVGNFNFDSQWIYYYVEGERYLETIQFDPSGTRVIHLDGGNLDSPPFMWTYPKAVRRIKENGAWFVVKNGKLVRE